MAGSNFFGHRVLAATFVLAMFGWGVGFYGPPIFLHTVLQQRGWSVALGSAAVTLHFLSGTFVIANLPRLYRYLGIARLTSLGAAGLGIGVYGWASAHTPTELLMASIVTGISWVTLGAAAVNTLISQWFVRKRSSALAMAYNGASIGGVVFTSGWVSLINSIGFAPAALLVGLLMSIVIGLFSLFIFRYSPEHMNQHPDGSDAPMPAVESQERTLGGKELWLDKRFLTLAAGMALGLFAQIGLIAHLYSILAPRIGEHQAGLAMGLATGSAIAGRSLVGWLMPHNANRRTVACACYAVQVAGSFALLMAHDMIGLIWLGMILFGAGIGNATSLPPLIAQAEFPRSDVSRVVALIVAISQGCYAFAPVLFGALRSAESPTASDWQLFALACLVQLSAIAALAVGKRKPNRLVNRSNSARS